MEQNRKRHLLPEIGFGNSNETIFINIGMQLFGIILIVLCLLASSEVLAAKIYVDSNATGTNDGSSWANAYNYLQDTMMACMGRLGLIQYPMNGTGVVTGPL